MGALSGAVHAWDLLKEVTIIFITSTIVRPQVNNREGTQIHPSTKTWIKDFLSIAPLIRTRARSPSVSLSYQEASISLLSLAIKARQNENCNHRKPIIRKLITWTTDLSN